MPQIMNTKDYENYCKEAKRLGVYISRTKIGMCKNEDCYNARRNSSAYCQQCADKRKETPAV